MIRKRLGDYGGYEAAYDGYDHFILVFETPQEGIEWYCAVPPSPLHASIRSFCLTLAGTLPPGDAPSLRLPMIHSKPSARPHLCSQTCSVPPLAPPPPPFLFHC